MLKIISAFYDYLDVSNIVRNNVIDDKKLDIIVSNKIFGDPNIGKIKNLIIKYEINNKEYEVTISENKSCKISEPDIKLNDNQVISTFLDFNYFPLFASFYNSLRYYNNNGKIKVYDWNNLNNFQLEYLSKFADIVTVKNPPSNYPNNFGFIAHNMADYLDDYELKMDCDMIALSNFDHIFDYLKDGYLVGCEELRIKPLYYCENHNDNTEREKFIDLFKGYTNLDLSKYNQNEDVPIYNGGFMGYSKEKHLDLLKNCNNIIHSDFAHKYFMINSDQNLLSFLLNTTKNYKIHNLQSSEWMNTWDLHFTPPKHITVDNNGKYKLYDAFGKLIKLYHFTGLVGYNILSDDQLSSVRGFQITGDYLSLPTFFNEDEITRRGQEMWRERNKTPINFLFEYFHNNGDFKTPKFYSVKFRKIVAEFCKEYFNNENIQNYSKEVLSVCIAYDYITLLDYNIDKLDWIEHILNKLFKIYNINYIKSDSKKTIGFDNDNCNVSLSFQHKPIFKPWLGSFIDNKELNVEEYLGLFITTKK